MNKVNYFDGLRGVAALIVFIDHFILLFFPAMLIDSEKYVPHSAFEKTIAPLPINILYNGNFSVCIFFVLSGYVLSIAYFKRKDYKVILSGALKRYFRLVVPVFVSVIFTLCIINLDVVKLIHSDVYTFFKTVFYSTFVGYNSQYNGVLWTMTYEFLGSFMIFGILLAFGKLPIRYPVYAIILFMLWNSYYSAFVIGLIICDLQMNYGLFAKLKNYKAIKIAILILALYFGSFPIFLPDAPLYNFLRFSTGGLPISAFYHIVGATLLMVVLLSSDKMMSLFSSKIATYLGRVSFSFYLLHNSIINTWGLKIINSLDRYYSYHLSALVSFLITLTISLFFAHVMTVLIDEKTVKLLNRLVGKITFLQAKNKAPKPSTAPNHTISPNV